MHLILFFCKKQTFTIFERQSLSPDYLNETVPRISYNLSLSFSKRSLIAIVNNIPHEYMYITMHFL